MAANKLSREEKERQLFDNAQSKGINFDKYDNIPVEANGRECPDCFETFEELMEIEALTKSSTAKQMLANLKRAGFTNPTPVQKWFVCANVLVLLSPPNMDVGMSFFYGVVIRSLPIALGCRDLMACAQTGSGKTGTDVSTSGLRCHCCSSALVPVLFFC